MSERTSQDASRRLSSEERRAQIIEAAIAVFGARGYVGTTTDEVARAASVSQPYVVRLFGTKENLFLAALQDALDRLLAAFRSAPRGDDLQARSDAMGAAYLGLLEVRGLHQILSHAFLLGSHPVIGPRAREGFAQVWRYLRDDPAEGGAGFSAEEAQKFLAAGMLINTMVGLRITDEYGADTGMTELFNECFPVSIDYVLGVAPRVDELW
ncbi:TetR/AcrR family transcriptional regulator [Microbacterium rhizomatis]|uniref:TetR/AcrR family transcriptional regulator n=1 Tax=Microbacterium rhizomatis TaxID=1631477 RepID=UPI00147920F2|nr:TetR/AcrR family transcriptional regulator [Microbacterium rhizomatis]